jgi:pimeloyl-ACP methyl ester carboxylesterase
MTQASVNPTSFMSNTRLSANEKQDLLLVHGAWLGGWVWKRILPLAAGSFGKIEAVTLPECLGLDGNLALEAHIQAIVDAAAGLQGSAVTLVGHSYAGLLIAPAAVRLLDQGLQLQMIYVDASVGESGESWSDQHPPELAARRRIGLNASPDATLPPPAAEDLGISSSPGLKQTCGRSPPRFTTRPSSSTKLTSV